MLNGFFRNGHGRNWWAPLAPTSLVRLSVVVPGHFSAPFSWRWITCSTCRSPRKPLGKPGRRRAFSTAKCLRVAHVSGFFVTSLTGRACRLARLNRPPLVGLVVPVLAGTGPRNFPRQARPFAVPHGVHRQHPHRVELPLRQAGDSVALGRSRLDGFASRDPDLKFWPTAFHCTL